jgi:uncharacterized protein YcfL
MKTLTVMTLLLSLTVVSCGSRGERREYDQQRQELDKQEAQSMIENADDIEIKRGGWGSKDRIIIND